LAAKADRPDDALDCDPDGDGDVEPVMRAEEKVDDQGAGRRVLALKG
jgi:hypothetical protein